ncbi:MAG: hypothetical protein R6X33_18125 [Candidatus Brocadiia bacterium]
MPKSAKHPETVECWLTLGDDDKAVISSMPPVIRRVVGTRRRGLYPEPGEWLWLPGLCLEGIEHVFGGLPAACRPTPCRLSLEPLEKGGN